MIVNAALQEDVDAIGLSILSGAHNYLFPKIMELMKEKGLEDVVVFAGGIIPMDDIPMLKEIGIRAIFTPGTPTGEVIRFVKENVRPRRTRR